jgi:hypothetical protein
VALIPVAERARIAWRGPDVYDPWEDIERTLFSSIVGSVVENMVPNPPRSLPNYGLIHRTYADYSFITERSERLRGSDLIFVELITVDDPFDTLRFVEIDAAFVPTGRNVNLPLVQATPELAAREGGDIRYLDLVEYLE